MKQIILTLFLLTPVLAQQTGVPVISPKITLQNAATGAGNGTLLQVNGFASAMLTVNCSSCSGGTIVNFEGTEDGTNFATLVGFQMGTTNGNQASVGVTSSGLTYWQFNVAGLQSIRARISNYSAGTITVTGHASIYPGPVFNTLWAIQSGTWLATQTGTWNVGQTGTWNVGQTGTWTVQPGNTANTTPWLVQAQPGTSGGLSWYNVEPAASDNHANIKNGAGVVYHVAVTNNSATVNYLRLYNAATGFNGCNSATNLIFSMIIPASTSGAGFVEDIAMGITFSTGISICVTSGYGQTNTTNATASAIEVNVGYK